MTVLEDNIIRCLARGGRCTLPALTGRLGSNADARDVQRALHGLYGQALVTAGRMPAGIEHWLTAEGKTRAKELGVKVVEPHDAPAPESEARVPPPEKPKAKPAKQSGPHLTGDEHMANLRAAAAVVEKPSAVEEATASAAPAEKMPAPVWGTVPPGSATVYEAPPGTPHPADGLPKLHKGRDGIQVRPFIPARARVVVKAQDGQIWISAEDHSLAEDNHERVQQIMVEAAEVEAFCHAVREAAKAVRP